MVHFGHQPPTPPTRVPQTPLCPQAAVKAVAWCPFQSNLVATGGGTADRCIKFWNTHTGACLSTIDTGSQVCAGGGRVASWAGGRKGCRRGSWVWGLPCLPAAFAAPNLMRPQSCVHTAGGVCFKHSGLGGVLLPCPT